MKTTARQFKVYREACQKWIDIFGLKTWRVVFRHIALPIEVAAQCTWYTDSGACYLDFNRETNAECDFSDKEIKRYAFHEVMHLVFGRVNTLAECRYTSQDEIDQEFHALIRLFENVILEQ